MTTKRFKVWYQLPMKGYSEMVYPPGWSAAFVYAESLENAKTLVNLLINRDKEALDKSGFVLHKIEEEKDRSFDHVLEEIVKDSYDD